MIVLIDTAAYSALVDEACGDAEVFAALLACVDAAQLHVLSSDMLDEELHSAHVTLTDALAAMQSVQEVQTRTATLERQQAAIGIPRRERTARWRW